MSTLISKIYCYIYSYFVPYPLSCEVLKEIKDCTNLNVDQINILWTRFCELDVNGLSEKGQKKGFLNVEDFMEIQTVMINPFRNRIFTLFAHQPKDRNDNVLKRYSNEGNKECQKPNTHPLFHKESDTSGHTNNNNTYNNNTAYARARAHTHTHTHTHRHRHIRTKTDTDTNNA